MTCRRGLHPNHNGCIDPDPDPGVGGPARERAAHGCRGQPGAGRRPASAACAAAQADRGGLGGSRQRIRGAQLAGQAGAGGAGRRGSPQGRRRGPPQMAGAPPGLLARGPRKDPGPAALRQRGAAAWGRAAGGRRSGCVREVHRGGAAPTRGPREQGAPSQSTKRSWSIARSAAGKGRLMGLPHVAPCRHAGPSCTPLVPAPPLSHPLPGPQLRPPPEAAADFKARIEASVAAFDRGRKGSKHRPPGAAGEPETCLLDDIHFPRRVRRRSPTPFLSRMLQASAGAAAHLLPPATAQPLPVPAAAVLH